MNESMLNNCFVKIIMICVLFYREMEGGGGGARRGGPNECIKHSGRVDER